MPLRKHHVLACSGSDKWTWPCLKGGDFDYNTMSSTTCTQLHGDVHNAPDSAILHVAIQVPRQRLAISMSNIGAFYRKCPTEHDNLLCIYLERQHVRCTCDLLTLCRVPCAEFCSNGMARTYGKTLQNWLLSRYVKAQRPLTWHIVFLPVAFGFLPVAFGVPKGSALGK